jgi:DNA repair exonuclease SbcCD ATPase subunit
VRYLYVCSVLAILLASTPANPATPADVMSVMNTLSAAKQQLDTALNEQSVENGKKEELIRETAAIKGKKASLQNQANAIQTEAQSVSAQIQNYQQRCPSGRVPIAVYNACHPDKVRIESAQSALSARAERVKSEAQELVGRAQANSQATLEWAQSVKRTNANISELRGRIHSLQARLSGWCTQVPANATLEAIKANCGNADFDRANRNLPPCDTPACREAQRHFPN